MSKEEKRVSENVGMLIRYETLCGVAIKVGLKGFVKKIDYVYGDRGLLFKTNLLEDAIHAQDSLQKVQIKNLRKVNTSLSRRNEVLGQLNFDWN